MTTIKDLIIDDLKDQVENLAYKNKRMGDFIELLGLEPDEITSYVINGDNYNDIQKAVNIIRETIYLYEDNT